jgi:hypothetical protein
VAGDFAARRRVSHGDGYLKLMRAKCGSRNISKDT